MLLDPQLLADTRTWLARAAEDLRAAKHAFSAGKKKETGCSFCRSDVGLSIIPPSCKKEVYVSSLQ